MRKRWRQPEIERLVASVLSDLVEDAADALGKHPYSDLCNALVKNLEFGTNEMDAAESERVRRALRGWAHKLASRAGDPEESEDIRRNGRGWTLEQRKPKKEQKA